MKMNISMFSNFLLYLRVHLHGFIVARSVGACRCLPVLPEEAYTTHADMLCGQAANHTQVQL